MLNLSEVLITEHDLTSFDELLARIAQRARASGAVFFRIDVKPPYADTPPDWEDRLESAFTSARET